MPAAETTLLWRILTRPMILKRSRPISEKVFEIALGFERNLSRASFGGPAEGLPQDGTW